LRKGSDGENMFILTKCKNCGEAYMYDPYFELHLNELCEDCFDERE